jgi:nicotinate-nucleotide pyrophosphorylase (carboxylating)
MISVEDGMRAVVRTALAEDVGSGDVTTESTVPEGQCSRARIVAKEKGVIAGLKVAEAVFRELDSDVEVKLRVIDGERVVPGDLVAELKGRTRAILTGERVALNFLQRLSGVATMTAKYADVLRGTGVILLDTRKTTPGMRLLEKYAVGVGGGANHRIGLWEMALIKENHIIATGGITPAISSVRSRYPDLAIEVEVRNLDELNEALESDIDRVMLDNMSIDEMRQAIRTAREHEHPADVEISGGVTLENLTAIAELGPTFISVGVLTHSAPALDLSLLVEDAEDETAPGD